MRSRRSAFPVAALAALVMVAAGGLLAWSMVRTASARFVGSTGTRSLFEAVTIELDVGDENGGVDVADARSLSNLLIDARGMSPGRVTERCVVVRYRGTAPDPRVRLYAERSGGSGLDRYALAEVAVGSGRQPDCSDFSSRTVLFDGTLAALADLHGSFASGVTLMHPGSAGSETTVRFRVDVESDNNAQGLDTAMVVSVEVRP